MKFILIIFLFSPSISYSFDKICAPKIINSYEEMREKLKVCDPGDKIVVSYNFNLQKEKLIVQICNLKYNVIYESQNETINVRSPSSLFSCIFQPTFLKN